MSKEKEPALERLLKLKKDKKIKDFYLEIPHDSVGVDSETGSKIYPVTCITIEKNNGGIHQISVESLIKQK